MKLKKLLEKKDLINLKKEVLSINYIDLANLLNDLENEDLFITFRLLDKERASQTFSYLSLEKQTLLIEFFQKEDIEEILFKQFSDDIVDLLEELPAKLVKKVLKYASKEKREQINTLLVYKEDSAGSIMTIEFLSFYFDNTVEDVLAHIRLEPEAESINVIYIKSAEKKLIGVISLRKLLSSELSSTLGSIMNSVPIYVNTHDDQEDVSRIFKKYDLNMVPVVDNEKNLVGIITVDDIIDVIDEEVTEDFEKMAGLEPSSKPYMENNVLILAKHRIVWLLVLMISATFTSRVIRTYEGVLESSVLLASFIPMLMDTGGNAGSQASSLIIRSLALGSIRLKDWFKVFFKELRVGMITGSALAVVNFLRLYFFEKVDLIIAITVCSTLIVTVTVSKTIGSLLPLAAKKLGQDPALMSGPLITTIVDTISLIVYFNIAMRILQL